MNAYTDFADVYDTFMDETPYEEWCEFLIQILEEYKVPKGLVLDLGCGTGTLTEMLSKEGYDTYLTFIYQFIIYLFHCIRFHDISRMWFVNHYWITS